jgi:hypothetical protein
MNVRRIALVRVVGALGSFLRRRALGDLLGDPRVTLRFKDILHGNQLPLDPRGGFVPLWGGFEAGSERPLLAMPR